MIKLNVKQAAQRLALSLLFGVTLFAPYNFFGENSLRAQSLENESAYEAEDLVLAVFLGRDRLSPGIFAIQQNGRFYLPASVLSDILGFQIDLDLATRNASGWTLSEERSYMIDVSQNQLIFRDEVFPLPANAVLDETVASDDLYILMEVLNEVWPLSFAVDLNALVLRIEPDDKLPFEKFLERKARQQRIAERRALQVSEVEPDYPFIPYPYQLLGKPSIDLQARTGFDARQDQLEHSASIGGVMDLLYASADFSTSYDIEGGTSRKPRNIRLRFTREDIHEGALPWDMESVQWGDVNLQNRELISSGRRGRGLIFTNDKGRANSEFDRITIDGVGVPGYEVELYINNQLLDFSVIDDTGVYEFEDVEISYGNNRIRVVLYGPQGQIEERVENVVFNSNMVKPGEYRYSGGVVDAFNDLIPVDDERTPDDEGLNANYYGAYGFSQRLTGFTTATTTKDDGETRNYLSVGAIASFPSTVVQTELYQDLSGGNAIDVRTASSFQGLRVNFQGSYFNDFQSPDSLGGGVEKEYELEADIRKTIRNPIANLGLEFGADYLRNTDDSYNGRLSSRQTVGLKGTRITNEIDRTFISGGATNTNGSIAATTRLQRWLWRNALGYQINPDSGLSNFSSTLRYGISTDYSVGFGFNHNFNSDEMNLSAQLSKDFKKFLGSVDANFSSEFGASLFLRASTSFGPYNQDGSYLMQSEQLRTAGPVSAFLYRDANYDGAFNEGDEPVPGTRIAIGRRVPLEETDENGYVTKLNRAYVGRVTDISVEESTIDDPYLVPAVDGYAVYPRPGVRQSVVFPLVDTGAIDGTIRWANDGKPIGGLEIQLMNDDGEIVAQSKTAVDGYYTFERVPPGNYTIRANPESGLNIPFEYVELTPDNLFQFGIDIEPVDLDRPMMVDLDVGVEKDGSLKANDILSLAKGFKTVGKKGMPVAPPQRENIQKAIQRAAPVALKGEEKAALPETKKQMPQAVEQPFNRVPVSPQKAVGQEMSVLDRIAAKMSKPRGPVEVENVYVSEGRNSARMTFDLSAPVEYSISLDNGTNSIFIEMPYASWLTDKNWQNLDTALLQSYAVEQTSATGARIILSVSQAFEIQSSGLLQDSASGKDSLYLDVVRK